ncbi:hypothetical protein [Streptomyces erythrochromogenes]|uniref:hypothetical protein n=1 Tax=Streptomyces erythrochromogenes TaxID=285574 RepID=UPI00368C88FE
MTGDTARNGAVHPPPAPVAGQTACAIPQQSPTPLGRLVATVERLRREVLEAQAAAPPPAPGG